MQMSTSSGLEFGDRACEKDLFSHKSSGENANEQLSLGKKRDKNVLHNLLSTKEQNGLVVNVWSLMEKTLGVQAESQPVL